MNNLLYIVWNDSNNVGIPIIDEQHRGIISNINTLHYFMQTGQGDDVIRPTMIMLTQYTEVHFKTEQALMKKAGYSLLEDHIRMHESLMKKTRVLTIDARKDVEPEQVLSFLKQWWLDHINKEDKKYAPIMKKLIGN